MEQNSLEASTTSVSKEIPLILWIRMLTSAITRSRNLSLLLVRWFQSTPPTYFLKIHLNINLPSMPTSYKLSPSRRFPHQKLVRISPLPRDAHLILPVLRIPVIPVQHHLVDTTHTACSACYGCFISTELNSPDLNSTTQILVYNTSLYFLY